SISGIGINALASAATGTTTGLLARVNSAAGTAAVFRNAAGGKILSGLGNGVEKFSVDGSGNVYANTYRDLAGNPIGSGSSNDLNCNACVSEPEVSFNYAGSSSKGGAATSALTAGTASNALSLGGIAAANYARRDTDSAFATTQTISSGDLSVSSGDISLPPTTSASAGVINLGGSPFIHGYGTSNTFVGASAGNFSTTGDKSVASGYGALFSNTSGRFNTASGYEALYSNTTGGRNTAGGYEALKYNTTGSYNTASGSSALGSNTTGWYNTAMGMTALLLNTTGSYNTASGQGALLYNCDNVPSDCTAHNNTAVGYLAGVSSNQANANVTGANNTFLGALSGPGTSTQLNNATAIGYQALVSASNSLVLGGTGAYAVNVGIGTETPAHTLDVVGDIHSSGSVTAASFTGNGAGLTGVNAAAATNALSLGGITAANYARLDIGNSFAGSQVISGGVTATMFLGNGSGLTGIAGGTGGVENTGSTTIGADTDSDGVGEIALQTRQATRVVVKNDGKVGIGTGAPASLLDVEGSSADQLVSVSQSGSGSGITATTAASGSLTTLKAAIVGTVTGSYVAGVAGISTADNEAGIFGTASGPNSTAGLFVATGGANLITAATCVGCDSIFAVHDDGSVRINGDLDVSGTISAPTKNFRIDDPLDPDHKFLYHASVESSEMMTMYTGNVTTDAHGDAVVELPAWFQALNRDFRYQLTVIGQFAQAIVAQEIANNRFTIKTDKAKVKVSWQVTGVRHDAYAKAHPLQVEVDKPERAP
ncbi:MAG: hypothetical protein ABSA70_13550, partial [Terriglobia bacterium]